MGFPNEKQLSKMRQKLEKAEGFLMLDPDASEIERFRFNICQNFLKYLLKEGCSSAEMAETLGVPKSDMSRILNHRIERFSTDKLLQLYSMIKPDYKLKVS